MNQSLLPSLLCALLATLLFGVAKSIDSGNLQNTLIFLAVVLAGYAFFYGLTALLDRLSNPIYAFGDVLVSLLHPDIAKIKAFGGLSNPQIDALMYQEGKKLLLLDEKGNPDWSIEMNHRRLSSHWVSQFLYKCDRFYPDFPPITMHTDKSKINSDEVAIRDFLRATGKIIPRPGRQDVWVDGHTHKTVRKEYFD